MTEEASGFLPSVLTAKRAFGRSCLDIVPSSISSKIFWTRPFLSCSVMEAGEALIIEASTVDRCVGGLSIYVVHRPAMAQEDGKWYRL